MVLEILKAQKILALTMTSKNTFVTLMNN